MGVTQRIYSALYCTSPALLRPLAVKASSRTWYDTRFTYYEIHSACSHASALHDLPPGPHQPELTGQMPRRVRRPSTPIVTGIFTVTLLGSICHEVPPRDASAMAIAVRRLLPRTIWAQLLVQSANYAPMLADRNGPSNRPVIEIYTSMRKTYAAPKLMTNFVAAYLCCYVLRVAGALSARPSRFSILSLPTWPHMSS